MPAAIKRMTVPSRDNVELTVLMPCLNEVETIGMCIEKAKAFIERAQIVAEVLVADNNSTDGSIEVACAKGARIVHVEKRGYGEALRAGIAAAHGRFIIIGDADDSYDFSRLEAFIAKLREGYDLVVGNRFRGGIGPGAMPFLHRYLGNPVLSLIGRIFFHTKTGDFHCGMRAFNRERILALRLRASGMEFASELIVASALHNYEIAEVPVTLTKDGRSRPPHLRTWRDGWRHLRFLLMFSPRWLFLYPGATLIAVGMAGVLLLLPGPVAIADGTMIDIHTFIIASIAILIGMQIVSFGLIARRLATANGFLPPSKRHAGLLGVLSLERGLGLAGAVTVAGLAGLGWSVLAWATVDFGPLNYPIVMRVLVLSLVSIGSGIQLAFASFVIGIVELPLQRD